MDNIEIQVYDEINDYKEKIYFFNIRQWIFAILITIIVIPTYLFLKEKIGEEITSYIIIFIAGILGFIGFVKIHELPAEKIIPYWIRHYFLFAKPIQYITDAEYELMQKNKKHKNNKKIKEENKEKTNTKEKKNNLKIQKKEKKQKIKEEKKKVKREKLLEKAKKKYGYLDNKANKPENKESQTQDINSQISERLSQLTKEQQDALLKLLGK